MGTLKPFTSIFFGRTTVSTAGTAVALTSAQETIAVTIRALDSNSGDVYVGDNTVDSNNGYPLSKGETFSVDIDLNEAMIYVDADNNGDGVAFFGGGDV
jgi:hypothetical protein